MAQNQLQGEKYGAKISVIVPVYNVERELPRCMESLLKQTYENLEIVLIDDGSTDNSGILCDSYCSRDRRCAVYHTGNGGLSAARNLGMKKASGEYFSFVDSDDYVDYDYIEYLYRLVENSGLRMSICQHRVQFENGNIREYGEEGEEILSGKVCTERMLYHDIIDTSAWGKLYARHLFETVQYPAGMLYEDIGTTYKLLMQCDRIAVGYQSKYTYVRRRNSIVNSSFHLKKLDLLEMTDKMGEDVVKRYPDLEAAVLRRKVYARISTLNQMIGVKGVGKKRRELLAFLKREGSSVLRNARAPRRDKSALLLIKLSYPLYCAVWLCYQWYLWKGSRNEYGCQ